MMTLEEIKHRRCLPPDVLRNLPDGVIDLIYMSLPLRDAVRTSILSKKWRYTWLRLTELTLDASLFETKKDSLDPEIIFTKIIDQVLTLCDGPINKLTLDTTFLSGFPEIDNLIYFLSRNNIQHLVLYFPLYIEYKLPSSLFMCLQLRHLTLHNCFLHPPLAFKGFSRLISLDLYQVTISSELLGRLISHCPLLEQLILAISEDTKLIEINAPVLRSFNFTGNISCISLKNVPLLEKVTLRGDYSEVINFGFAEFLKSCSALEHLELELFHTKFSVGEVPARLPSHLKHVKRLYLRGVLLDESYQLSCILYLLRSSPQLEYLEMEVYSKRDAAILESLELGQFSDVTFTHLREVKLSNFTGNVREMQVFKIMLAKSPGLVRMLIDPCLQDKKLGFARLCFFLEKNKLLAELSKSWCASSKEEEQVIYIEHKW